MQKCQNANLQSCNRPDVLLLSFFFPFVSSVGTVLSERGLIQNRQGIFDSCSFFHFSGICKS